MKLLTSAILLLSLGTSSQADDFVEKFETLKKAGKKAEIEKFLEKAAIDEAENPNYYAAAGNYWWKVAGSVSVSPIKEGTYELNPKNLSIIDPKTGKAVGALGRTGTVKPWISKKALDLLADGARKFPERADISLGLAHIQKEMDLKEDYVSTLVTLLATAKKDPEKFTWKNNGALPKPANAFLPETVQAYSSALFNANTPDTDALCAKLLAAVTDAFPDHPFAYNLKAALADATGKPEEAQRMLEIAHEKAPDDPLILSNLAGAYAKNGQTEKAIATYEKVLKLDPNPRSRSKAEAALEQLRKE